ncbi:MAG: MazG nucleotide pyrophosphohydrolase domain-containing protein [Ilumatobacteraceae bacterium]
MQVDDRRVPGTPDRPARHQVRHARRREHGQLVVGRLDPLHAGATPACGGGARGGVERTGAAHQPVGRQTEQVHELRSGIVDESAAPPGERTVGPVGAAALLEPVELGEHGVLDRPCPHGGIGIIRITGRRDAHLERGAEHGVVPTHVLHEASTPRHGTRWEPRPERVRCAAVDLATLQEVIEGTYGDRDRARGVPSTVAWLAEELGELAQAVRKGTVEQQRHEFADVLAWWHRSQPARHRPERRHLRYAHGCPRCDAMPCGCP